VIDGVGWHGNPVEFRARAAHAHLFFFFSNLKKKRKCWMTYGQNAFSFSPSHTEREREKERKRIIRLARMVDEYNSFILGPLFFNVFRSFNLKVVIR